MSEPHDFTSGSIEFGAMRRWRLKEERGTTKPAYCNKAPSPGRCGVVAIAGNLMTPVGLRSIRRRQDWRSATAPKPGQWLNQDTRQHCWPNQTFGSLCQGLCPRRCEPLGSDGTAGRLWRRRRSARYLLQPRHADVEVVRRLFHDHVTPSAERRGRKILLNFLGVAPGWSSIATLLAPPSQ